LERDTDHSPLTNVEFKNEWLLPSGYSAENVIYLLIQIPRPTLLEFITPLYLVKTLSNPIAGLDRP
jgi:hypothetical protein